MNRPARVRPARVAAVALTALAALAPAAGAGGSALVTAKRAGEVHLGELATTLTAHHLIGRIRHGCPLGGSATRSARLTGTLTGTVDFTLSSPRRVSDISVTAGGRTARGIGIGATLRAVRAAYPKARVDNSLVSTFGVIAVDVPRREGGPIQLDLDHKTKKLVIIGIPFVATCD